MTRRQLLVEIGTEELPPQSLQALARAFAGGLAKALAAAGVLEDGADGVRHFATPRRLAALIDGVAARQPARVSERKGPSLAAAFDAHGKPSRAAEGFARSCGVSVAQLAKMETDKGAWLVHRQRLPGAPLAAVVTECLAESLRHLPIAKRMRWGDGETEFVRPAHWLLALHGSRVVATEALGLKAGRHTRGHRFHANRRIAIADAADYARALETEGKVIADFDQRRRVIQSQLSRLAARAGAQTPHDPALLDLVTGLVELPRALAGEFDRRFLKLPPEALVACMRDHQKFFPLTNDKGRLLPGFITVSNIASKARARVRRGNERVLRARLADAEFFWHSDLKTPLGARAEALKGVLFHHRLGSLHDKTARVVQLSRVIAEQLGADVRQAGRAAGLCKADLVTDMVGEFPELQGVIGRRCAQKAGEERPVADAIEQHYLPRSAGAQLPRHPVAQSVALADRIDSLAGLFAGGEIPSGDKDPFALRRAALGVLRICIEKKLALDVRALLDASRRVYENADGGASVTPDDATVEQVFDFILERLKAYYQPLGYGAAEVASVLACRPPKPLDFDRRLKALSRFFKRRPEAAESLAAANKRISGILQRAAVDAPLSRYDPALLRQPAERELARQLEHIGERAAACFAANRYDQGFVALSQLKRPVDSFFDEVMVMDENPAVRANRLALLSRIRQLFLGVADISLMRPEQ